MKSEWRVTSNYINGKTMYAVYRLIDVNEINHSGNREYVETGYMGSRKEAEELAAILNEREGTK